MISLTPGQVESVVKRINETASWEELQKSIDEDNIIYDFENICLTSQYHLIAACYSAIRNEETKEDKTATVVAKGNVKYHIYGISHNERRTEYLEQLFAATGIVICEPEVEDLFEKIKAVPQSRKEECKYVSYDDYEAHLYYYDEKIHITNADEEPGISEREVLDLEGRITNMQDILLPERHEESYVNFILEETQQEKTVMLRSLSQSQFLEKVARHKKMKEIHGVYGIFHEPEIAYFLRNPEKAADISEKHKLRNQRQYAHEWLPFVLGASTVNPAIGGITYAIAITEPKTTLHYAGLGIMSFVTLLSLAGTAFSAYTLFIKGWNRRRKLLK